MNKYRELISMQPYWGTRKNVRVYCNPVTGRPLIATYEVCAPDGIDVLHTIEGNLLTGFYIPLDQGAAPLLCGTITKPTDISLRTTTHVFGCHLFPGCFTQIFGVPNRLIPPKGINMADVICSGDFFDQIYEADDQREREAITYQFVLKNLSPQKQDDQLALSFHMIDTILNYPDCTTVKQLSESTQFSPRHLQRIMQENVGITPKMAISNVRFQQAVRGLLLSEREITSIAYDCGYCDQAHFSHDFKRRAGCSPLVFRKSHGVTQ